MAVNEVGPDSLPCGIISAQSVLVCRHEASVRKNTEVIRSERVGGEIRKLLVSGEIVSVNPGATRAVKKRVLVGREIHPLDADGVITSHCELV